MTAAEAGVLLLCCRLGDPDCKPLTAPQFRELGHRVRASSPARDSLQDLSVSDLTALGYDETQAETMLRLLDRERLLTDYLRRAEDMGIHPLTRISPGYPKQLSSALGFSAPTVLFYKGSVSLLTQPCVAMVGSRQLRPENEAFTRKMGRYLAETKRVLVSGGALGADRVAQSACLSHGGSAIIFTAERLKDCKTEENTLFLSADGYDAPFSTPRALTRNKYIHVQGQKALAVQCTLEKGGTWQGSMENLTHGWSPLYAFNDGSDSMRALEERGAVLISRPEELDKYAPPQESLFLQNGMP